MYNYPGNIHVHSCYSDGRGGFDQIAREAASAGLSYIVITDHETLEGLPEESIKHGVVLLVGAEINRKHSHYVALDLKEMIESDEVNPQNVIDRVKDSGGLGFLAHPFEKGHLYIEKGKAYPWIYWPVFNFNGLELWNYTSHWRGRDPSPIKTLYWFFFNRKAAMDGPPPEALKLWDCYNNQGYRLTAIGSSDAHAALYGLGPFKFSVFSYRYIFKTINTYIVLNEKLSKEFASAKRQIVNALYSGHCYLSFDSLYPSNDFYYYASAKNKFAVMGDTVSGCRDLTIRVKAPTKKPLVRLIRNGRLVLQKQTADLAYNVSDPGIYRVEVYYRTLLGNNRPWIYSNPIYISSS
ncbi:MAG: CehA/McbA family metallohydrolase [Bacillota bacterium]